MELEHWRESGLRRGGKLRFFANFRSFWWQEFSNSFWKFCSPSFVNENEITVTFTKEWEENHLRLQWLLLYGKTVSSKMNLDLSFLFCPLHFNFRIVSYSYALYSPHTRHADRCVHRNGERTVYLVRFIRCVGSFLTVSIVNINI